MNRFKVGERITPGKEQHKGTVLMKVRVVTWILDLEVRSSFRTKVFGFVAPLTREQKRVKGRLLQSITIC